MFSLPNLLTWGRLLAIPFLIGLYFLPIDFYVRDMWATAIFIAAAITDWLDGYLARKLGQMSAFGAFLDPVADKLIVATALIILVSLGRLDALVACIIVGREITISALREWMAELGQRASVAVHSLGKFKTIAQLVAIPMLLFDRKLLGVIDCRVVGYWLMLFAAVLTVWSMLYYLKQALPYFRGATTPVPTEAVKSESKNKR
jgi:cardiolipin synthase (CMP-forming)